MTEKHKQEAREPERIKVCIRAGEDDWIGIAYAMNAGDPSTIHEYVPVSLLSSRDKEIREVLEGLRGKKCWCEDFYGHTPACLAARRLWDRLQS